jgi:putative ABC transport system permease protein
MNVLIDVLRDLRAHRLRSALSGLSLFIGILAVVGVVTTGDVVQDVFVATAEQAHGRQVTVQTQIPKQTIATRGLAAVIQALHNRIDQAGGWYALTYEAAATVTRAGAEAVPATITLVDGAPERIRRVPLVRGNRPGPDTAVYPGGLLANQAAVERFGPVGTRLTVDLDPRFASYPQDLIGEIADGNPAPMLYESMTSAHQLQPAVLATASRLDLYVHADQVGEPSLRAAVRQVDSDLGIDPSEAEIIRVDTVGQLVSDLETTRLAFVAIAILTLVVAGIGLLNVGLSTVRDRARELTVRRATGATRTRVFVLVLSSSIAVGLVAAVVAIAVAAIAVLVVVPHFLSPASPLRFPGFPYRAAVAGLLAAFGASGCGGVIPAFRATRVHMADALRE